MEPFFHGKASHGNDVDLNMGPCSKWNIGFENIEPFFSLFSFLSYLWHEISGGFLVTLSTVNSVFV